MNLIVNLKKNFKLYMKLDVLFLGTKKLKAIFTSIVISAILGLAIVIFLIAYILYYLSKVLSNVCSTDIIDSKYNRDNERHH